LTPVGGAGYPRLVSGGRAIPDLAQHPAAAVTDPEAAHDLDRLQRAVETLVKRYRALRAENARLLATVEERDDRLRVLNQRRQDAVKRIDDLVAQIEELDARFEAGA
jgi:chromosome segregation ATPase